MKNNFKLLIFGITFCVASYGQSDSTTSRNNAYIEFIGNGGLYSINYERLISSRFALRVGFASWKTNDVFGGGARSFITVPLMGNVLIGQRKSKLELGTGFLFGQQKFNPSSGSGSNTSTAIFDLTGVIGYRLQPSNGGFVFRASATPFYSLTGGDNEYPDTGFFISGGISFGYNF